jgi:carboxylesterase type B
LQGIQDATKYGKVSPQMKTDIFDGTKIMGIKIDSLMGLFIRLFIKTHIQQESEDECLNINVQIPLDTSPDAKLPVAFFM